MAKQLIPDNFISNFLNTVIYESSWISLNFWSIVHFCSGALLFAYFKDPIKVFMILVCYEVFEFVLWGIMFKQETPQDIIWDLIIGSLGMGFMYLLKLIFKF